MIDTHTHLYDEKFDIDRREMIGRAIDAGVSTMLMPNCDSGTIDPMLLVEKAFPAHCIPMMGLHPCYVNDRVEEELLLVEQWLGKRNFIAVGEIGLDYYWDKTFVGEQQMAFRRQIGMALEYDLPVVIHTRDAMRDTVDIVKEYSGRGLRGVFHCFSGSYEMAVEIIGAGLYLGIGGVLTYKNAGLQEVVAKLDPSKLVLETDAPYLTPAPHRGKRNESAYLLHVAEKLAVLLNTNPAFIIEKSSENARQLFRLDAWKGVDG